MTHHLALSIKQTAIMSKHIKQRERLSMRVGLLTSDLNYRHGWGTYSLSLLKSLQAHGIDLTIVSARNNTYLNIDTQAILPSVAPQERFSMAKMALIAPQVRDLLRECDVIHTTIELYAPLVDWIAGVRPRFMTAHGSYIHLPRIRRFPVDRIYQRAFRHSQIICVSQHTQTIAHRVIPDAQTHVIRNAVDAERFADIQHQASPTPTIVTLGGVKQRKGTLELIEAVSRVREQLPDVQCHVLGSLNAEVRYVERVRARIEALGLQDNVTLHGFVSDAEMRQWYARADVFALPSIDDGWKFEGFGLATMEASASGVAVIGTRQSGASDAIDDGETGILISADHLIPELSDALLYILSHPERARKMGDAGRRKAQAHSWQNVGTQVIGLYREALKS
ncbi:MAG: glycosyltransferase family 4 protein [Anaerolineae bacterium]